MTEQRTVLFPEGLAVERVDTAIARMFGVSRTRAAELIAEGYVRVDSAGVGKSDRVHSGAMLEVEFPQRADPLEIKAEIVEGRSEEHTSELQSLMRISYAVFCLKKKKIKA